MTKLSGRITVHGDKPASSATVELHNATGDVVDQVVVDDNGNFDYHLAPGMWKLNVYDAHGHRGHSEVSLGDEDQRVDLDLSEPEGGH